MLMMSISTMRIPSAIFVVLFLMGDTLAKDCLNKSNSKLLCYYSKVKDINSCKCSHVVLPANTDLKSINSLKERLSGVKILVTVHEFSEGLVRVLRNSKVDGLEINLRKLDSKNDISDFISTVRSKLGSDLYVALSVPPKAELLAKYFDFKALSKSADLFVLQTGFLGANGNVTFHPSRLSGLWDMQNADSVVDLVSGLGAPLSKLVLTAPVQALRFTLQDEEHTAPGSPALEVTTLTRDQLCSKMSASNWTLERDQDQAGPYIFRKKAWIAFDDAISMDIKAKYSRVRGLAGLALKDVSQDGGDSCGGSLLEAAYTGLSKQARAPRGAVLHSLEREILASPSRSSDNIHVSPYRISRVIDTEGKVHVIRQDTRTEFECSRQGYFVHPRSCGRFYRCVKFDQLTDEYSVFEFDCPAGLAFDGRVEVCVWPGSLPHASACSGSSEIAPVPKNRFDCPGEPGYYADPENCRWFFACLDHGRSPLTAYEFRCPFGLVFDQDRLLCEWPWLVPKCGSRSGSAIVIGIHQPSVTVYGGNGLAGAGSFVLENYDGLGQLGSVALGGVRGHIEQPVAKMYSSFATLGAGQGTPVLSHNAIHAGQDLVLVGEDLRGQGIPAQSQNTIFASQRHSGGVNGQSVILNGQGVGPNGQGVVLNGQSVGLHGQSIVLNGQGLQGQNAVLNGQDLGLNGQNVVVAGQGVVLTSQDLGSSNIGSYQEASDVSGSAGAGATVTYHGNGAFGIRGTGADKFIDIQNSAQRGSIKFQSKIGLDNVQLTGSSVAQDAHENVPLNIGQNAQGATDTAGDQVGTVTHHGNVGLLQSSLTQGAQDNNGAVILQQTNFADNKLQTAQRGSIRYHGNANLDSGIALDTHVNGYSNELQGANQQSAYDINGVDFGNLQIVKDSGIEQGNSDAAVGQAVSYHGSNDGSQSGNVIIQNAGLINGDYQGAGLVTGVQSSAADLANINAATGDFISAGSQGSLDSSNIKQAVNYGGNSGQLLRGNGFTATGSASQGNVDYQLSNGFAYTAAHGPADFSNNIQYQGKFGTLATGQTAADLGGAFVSKETHGSASLGGGQQILTYQNNAGQGLLGEVEATRGQQISNTGAVVQSSPAFATHQNDNSNYKSVQFFGNTGSQLTHENQAPDIDQSNYKSAQFFGNTAGQAVQQNHGVAGTIDIIGGGFSAVTVGSDSKNGGVQLIRHGVDVDSHVTAVPVSVTPSSISTSHIPVVTSVPVPAIKTATGFDVFKGGVVANVPELQYKLESPKVINNAFFQSQSSSGTSGFANASGSIVTHASSTAAPLLAVTEGYAYTNPAVTLVRGQSDVNFAQGQNDVNVLQPTVSTYTYTRPVQKNVVGDGYVYAKPSVEFHEGPNLQQPAVSFVHQQPEYVQQPIVLSTPATVEKVVVSGGYHYPKPSISFEEKPVVSLGVAEPVQPAVFASYSQQTDLKSQGYEYRKPATVSSFSISQPFVTNTGVQPSDILQPISVSQPSVENTVLVGGAAPAQPAVVSSFSFSQPSEKTVVVPVQPTSYISQPSLEKTVVPVNLQPTIQPASVSSYSYQQAAHQGGGYVYSKPSVSFEERPLSPAIGLIDRQPCRKCNIQPVVSSYNYQQPHSQQTVVSGGYQYGRPELALDVKQQPTTVEQIQPIVPEALPTYTYQKQPATSYSYQNIDHSKSSVAFGEKTVQTVTPSTVGTYTLRQPAPFEQKGIHGQPVFPLIPVAPVVNFEQPELVKTVAQPAVVSSYYYQKPAVQTTADAGYRYPNPSVQFVEEQQPVVTTYENREPVKEVPFVTKKAYVTGNVEQKPTVVESYSISSPKPVAFVSTNRPIITQYVSSTPRPFYSIPSYQNLEPVKEEPFVAKKSYVTGYVYQKPSIPFEEERATFASTSTPLVDQYHSTPRPTFLSVINREPVKEELLVAKKAYVTGYQNTGYVYQRPEIQFQENTNVVLPNEEAYYPTAKSTTYVPTNRPTVYAITPTPIVVSSTQRPTFASTIASLVAAKVRPLAEKFKFYSYDSRLSSTPAPVIQSTLVPVTQSRPISQYSFSSLDEQYNNYGTTPAPISNAAVNFQPDVAVTQTRPVSRYSFGSYDKNYVSGTNNANHFVDEVSSVIIPKTVITQSRRTNFASTVPTTLAAEVPVTQSRPISRYSFSSLDAKYNNYAPSPATFTDAAVGEVVVSTPRVTYVPTSTEPYQKITVTTPTRAYLPAKTTQYVENYRADANDIRIDSNGYQTDTKDFLANANDFRIDANDFRANTNEFFSTEPNAAQYVTDSVVATKPRRPVKVIKVVRPKSQAIVKVNDFHPLLAAKLGAQCTCVSNTLRLRKKPVRVQIYDDDDVDEYIVKPNTISEGVVENNNGVSVEDYNYEPEKIVEITPTPDFISSTSVVPSSRVPVVVRKRVRVRPYTSTFAYSEAPVTKATDIFLKSTPTPAVQILEHEDDGPSRKDVEDVVRKGLSLIKSAAKQGAKEAIANHMFDRYGPGGVRSRDETLQGIIDCQRAGLFRHPTHCNRFYACRWDCTKNRFTLHVFNCPVHLTFDNNLGACNWPSQGPACLGNTLLPSD